MITKKLSLKSLRICKFKIKLCREKKEEPEETEDGELKEEEPKPKPVFRAKPAISSEFFTKGYAARIELFGKAISKAVMTTRVHFLTSTLIYKGPARVVDAGSKTGLVALAAIKNGGTSCNQISH